MGKSKEDVLKWLKKHRKKGGNLMKCMHDLVLAFTDKSVSLKNPAGAEWVICDLNGTIYNKDQDVLNKLQKFYLPDEVKMQVIGKVIGTSCPCEQLLLLACNDGNIYAYDGEELHAVASELEQLCTEGLEDPASQSYYKGEAFKDLTEEDWNKVRQSEVGKILDREHDALVNAYKSRFLESLEIEAERGPKMSLEETEPEKRDRRERKELKPVVPSLRDRSETKILVKKLKEQIEEEQTEEEQTEDEQTEEEQTEEEQTEEEQTEDEQTEDEIEHCSEPFWNLKIRGKSSHQTKTVITPALKQVTE